MESFTYDHIDLERPAFRLLRLLKGEGRDVFCELFQAWLHQRESVISYEALSYTWGFPENTDSIVVNGRRLGVTMNLYLALQYLRFRDQDRILWVDAICIDQNNLKERGHQIQQMGEIYKQADRVIFWLGPATYETNVVMDSLQRLQEESVNTRCKDWKRADQSWVELWTTLQPLLQTQYPDLETRQREGLQSLLSRPWFRRVWILQEVANAQAALVCCGKKSVRARFLALAPLLMDVKPDSHCQAVLDIMPGPSRKDSWWNQSRNLHTLLKNFGRSEAHDPRDMIYALLGISSDANNSNILRPDYGKSEKDLVCSVIRFLYCDIDLAPTGQPTTIRTLLRTLTSYAETKDGGWMPLCWAAANNYEAVVKQLLSQSADIEAKDAQGRTPLFWAIQNGNEGIIGLLLEKGANIEAKNTEGQTPLFWAAQKSNRVAIELLLKKGANIEGKDTQGQTPLFWAARNLYKAAVELLLEKGANIEAKDTQGQTPLSWAQNSRRIGIKVRDAPGQTPLSWFDQRTKRDIVYLLLAKGGQ
ncbi:ankyrin [Xylariaceae sp. AK1471]|nr:ankyrin [Xylariaceae sp. AK1471]